MRLPALQLLITARSLGRALQASHERTVAMISGEVQRKATAAAAQYRRNDLEAEEEEVGQLASARSERMSRPSHRGGGAGGQSARSSAGGGGEGGGGGGGSQCGTERSEVAGSEASYAMQELQLVNKP